MPKLTPRARHNLRRLPWIAACTALVALPLHADELPRRGLMGVQLGPVTAELATELKLEKPDGFAVLGVFPDTAAAAAGLQAQDVVVSVDGKPVATLEDGLNILRTLHAGDTAKLGIIRAGKPLDVPLTLRERPRETSTDFEITYDCAGEPGHRVRTYVSRPKDDAKHPAILLVQSLNPGPVEFSDPRMANHPYKRLADELTRAGFVVMRAEREGNGDSEGGDPRHPKLANDVASFNAALTRLAAYDFVDAQRVYVFAQSSGAAIAPALARNPAVDGVITYAAIARPWTEHLPETLAARWKLGMRDEAEIKADLPKVKQFVQLCLVEGKNPQEVLSAHPELTEITTGLVQDEFVMGSHYSFFHELAALDLGAQWKEVKVPVLALWGKSDFVATRACSEFVASSATAGGNARARFVALAGIDHSYAPMEDAEESFLAGFVGEFNPVIIKTIKQWVEETATNKAA
ncbi:MAG TPA: PDZ domain-containing protein [Phycisphaerae bacterium]|nr:PDZ domain-containing protein [Phycisphaerae bacterium]